MTAEVERVVAQVLTAARVEDVRQAIAQAIAQALADARQPFLDLADAYAANGTRLLATQTVIARLHAAAQDPA